MPRLPVVSSDADIWGNVLNSYLGVALNTDGTLKPGAAVKLKAGAISDADFTTTPPDGALGVNTNAGALAFRNLGAWLQLLPSRAKAGVLIDSDFGAGPIPAGALGVNTALPALSFRTGAAWFQILPPKAKAGTITDADFGTTPPDGTFAVNTSANALAYRSAGSWFQIPAVQPPLVDSQLPVRLQAAATQVPGAGAGDCNNAIEAGWYYAIPATLNIPSATYWAVFVVNVGTTHVRQLAYDYTTDQIWMRRCTTGVWGSWVKTWPLGGNELDYKQSTVDFAAPTTEATWLQGNSVSYDGTRVKIEVYVCGSQSGGAGAWCAGAVYRDSTNLGQHYFSNSGGPGAIKVEVFDTPPAGMHAYRCTAWQAGNYTLRAAAPTWQPAFIRVTKA